MVKVLVLSAVLFVLVAAAVEDMARLRISNIFPLLVIGLYAAWVAVVGWENDIWRNGTVFLGMFALGCGLFAMRSEEHTSELQSLMRISYAVFCLEKKNNTNIAHVHSNMLDS